MSEMKWVPVGTGLPGDGREVLMSLSGKYDLRVVVTGRYHTNLGGWFREYGNGRRYQPKTGYRHNNWMLTAWMYVPEPYTEQNHGS